MSDKIVGWDIDIAREITKALGVQLEIHDMRFAGLLEAVRKRQRGFGHKRHYVDKQEGKGSGVLYALLLRDPVVTKAARTDINKVEDLYGKTVGV
jgi:polar amino acid transport system substrate-binding protein